MKKSLLLIVLVLTMGQMFAQNSAIWIQKTTREIGNITRARPNGACTGELYFSLDLASFQQSLVDVKDKFSALPGVPVKFPNLNGELETFLVWDNSNFEPALQSHYPQIRSYVGQGVTDKYATINFSVSPQGIQTMVFRADNGTEYMEAYDKAATTYVLFNSNNRVFGRLPFNCSTHDVGMVNDMTNKFANTTLANNAKYKTFRLALSCTAEYSNYFGATSSANVALVLTAMNNTMTRVNGVMEKDLAVHLNIIANNDQVIYYDPTTDPYSDAATGSGGTWNAELMNALTGSIGSAAFDIGHLFGADGGGGNAGCIGCVCSNDTSVDSGGSPINYKGSGFTSPSDAVPAGDTFDIDYVVHEMGHQLGANHSFTYGYEGTVAQVEPGSGSTIMGYAGITSYDVQAHSDALYCYKNISQIQSKLNLAAANCAVTTSLTGVNATPTANGGLDYTIPKSTPFMLTGTASDADASDVLTYNWEQNDAGTSATTNATSRVLGTKTAGPNFRIFPSSSSMTRYFPQMSKILGGAIVVTTASNANWESCSSAARTLHFTFTARDNHPGMGQTATDNVVVTVDDTVGPLAVTSQATTGIIYPSGSTQTVVWTGTNTSALTGAANVDVLLSTNNGVTWTTIATAVPNNGTATVTLPNLATASSTCRFMVRASANVFFALNSKNFTIQASLGVEEVGFNNFSLYPNPNKGNFNIQFDNPISNEIKVNVFDMRGRKIFDNSYANETTFNQNIQLNTIESGVYLVSVTDGTRKIVKRIIIE